MFLKITAHAFEAGDFLNIFLRFWAFKIIFFDINCPYKTIRLNPLKNRVKFIINSKFKDFCANVIFHFLEILQKSMPAINTADASSF